MDSCCICKLQKIYKAIDNFELQIHKSLGLNFNEMTLLCILSDGQIRLAGEIADKLELTRSNASKVIASLEKKSMIKRRICKEDSRCQQFVITKKGHDILDRVHAEIAIPEVLQDYMKA